MITLADQYYIKALDHYPYDLEEALEQMNYALGCDPDHAGANLLMGKMYMEQFRDLDKAEGYFNTAIASDPSGYQICACLIRLFIEQKAFDKALKVVKYAHKLSTACVAELLQLEALVHELQKDLAQARQLLIRAMEEAYDNDHLSYLEKELERVEGKMIKKRIFFMNTMII